MLPSQDYLKVPSIGLAVSREKVLLRFSQDLEKIKHNLHSNGKKLLNLYEFAEFLKKAKQSDFNLYNKITQISFPGGSELFDTRFKLRNGKMWVYYHKFTKDGIIIPDFEILDSDTLMESKYPGISLEDWVENHTKQGLPKKSIREGNMHYWKPKKESFASFGVGGIRVNLESNLNQSRIYSFGTGVRFAITLK